ncbi:MAG: JAB domain-containing protein [Bacteroidetes bacterium]|nr:JAB domain-containing protein [Bacteroidota bacterium]
MKPNKSYPITQWAEDDRPREKLLLKGKGALSDAELIAILLRSGNIEDSAVDLAKEILNKANNNLIELSKFRPIDLFAFNGIGEAKALSIIAALELGKRRRGAEVLKKEKIGSSKDGYDYFVSIMEDYKYENFWILLLNTANKILKHIQISEGGVSGTIADPKKIFNIAIEHGSSGIILCHNHPSGNIKPSEADIKLTKKIIEGGRLLDINVLDHIIIGEETYFSFADENMM